MGSATPPVADRAVGRAMFQEIAGAKNAREVAAILDQYLTGPSAHHARTFLAAYLCRTTAGWLPDPQRLEP